MRKAKGAGHVLVAHDTTPPRAVSSVYCTSIWRNAGEWKLDFMVAAPPSALRLPAATAAQRTDGLWHHTCFELFLLDPADGSYLEFNFSPSGEWAAYQFDGYRSGMRELDVTAPLILTSDPTQIHLAWSAHLRKLGLDEQVAAKLAEPLPSLAANIQHYWLSARFEHPGLWRGITCRAGLSAVIEEADGTKSYWALAHPPGKPDFHRAEGFALELPPAGRRRGQLP